MKKKKVIYDEESIEFTELADVDVEADTSHYFTQSLIFVS
jgi:hypothetical protein